MNSDLYDLPSVPATISLTDNEINQSSLLSFPLTSLVILDGEEWLLSRSASTDDEEIPAPAMPLSPSVSELFFSDNAGNAAPAQEEGQEAYAPAAHPVPRSPLEGKSSLRTRSMARVLEEQGAFSEAADIYRELLEVSTSEEERAELCARLEHLSQGAENAAAQPASSGILDMLETLAVRLENKSRA